MSLFKTKIDENGGIVIPKEYLQALGLRVGDDVIVRLEDSEIHIFSVEHGIIRSQELLRPYLPHGRSLSEELIVERRANKDI